MATKNDPQDQNRIKLIIKKYLKEIPLELVDGSITTLELANGAVTEIKLANGAVTEIKLADEAVTEIKLARSIKTITNANSP